MLRTYHENELIELKNHYLRKLEMRHYKRLKQEWEQENRQRMKDMYRDHKFQREVFERAQRIMQQRQQQEAGASSSSSKEKAEV